MSEPSQSTNFGKWVDGEFRFDQVAYDKWIKPQVQGASSWAKTWVKWLYDRDLPPGQAGINVLQKVIVDYSAAAVLEKKIPQFRTISSYWPMWTAYIYLKKPAEFHTLLFTAVDNSFRSYFKEYPAQLEKAEFKSDPFGGHGEPSKLPGKTD